MSLSIEEIHRISRLARLRNTNQEAEDMRDQLSKILDHFDVLQQVDTEFVELSGHPLDLQNTMRDDEVAPSLSVEDVFLNVPTRSGDYVRVRAILE